jgi:hypothetical protein
MMCRVGISTPGRPRELPSFGDESDEYSDSDGCDASDADIRMVERCASGIGCDAVSRDDSSCLCPHGASDCRQSQDFTDSGEPDSDDIYHSDTWEWDGDFTSDESGWDEGEFPSDESGWEEWEFTSDESGWEEGEFTSDESRKAEVSSVIQSADLRTGDGGDEFGVAFSGRASLLEVPDDDLDEGEVFGCSTGLCGGKPPQVPAQYQAAAGGNGPVPVNHRR